MQRHSITACSSEMIRGDPTADDLTQLAAAQWEEHLQKWLGVEKRSIHVLYSGADAAAVEVRKDRKCSRQLVYHHA